MNIFKLKVTNFSSFLYYFGMRQTLREMREREKTKKKFRPYFWLMILLIPTVSTKAAAIAHHSTQRTQCIFHICREKIGVACFPSFFSIVFFTSLKRNHFPFFSARHLNRSSYAANGDGARKVIPPPKPPAPSLSHICFRFCYLLSALMRHIKCYDTQENLGLWFSWKLFLFSFSLSPTLTFGIYTRQEKKMKKKIHFKCFFEQIICILYLTPSHVKTRHRVMAEWKTHTERDRGGRENNMR